MKFRALCASLVGVITAAALGAYLLQDRTLVRPDQPYREAPSDVAPDHVSPIRNVILVSMDTTRWDAISSYNAPEVNSPNIGAFSRENVVFQNAYAPIPVTLPSHATMLTGKIPPAHGVLDNGRYSLADEHVTLAEVLKEHGFNTAAFVSALVMDSKFGLDQGFDTYDDAIDDDIDESVTIGERRGDITTSQAIEWLVRHQDQQNFIFLHLFDPHAPYRAPEPFASKIKQLYQEYPEFVQNYVAEIAFTDYCIGLLIQKLKELNLYDNSLICITADHGESHGEHGENTHGFFIYTSTTRVPFVFKVPGVKGPLRVEDPVGIIDIAPTILSLLGLSLEEKVRGRDLAGYIQGESHLYPARSIFSMCLEPRKYGGNSLLGIIVGNFKYIQTTRPELYDLSRDVYEKKNLIDIEAQRARQLREKLQAILGDAPSETQHGRISVDTDTLRFLESLGYVTTGQDDDDLDLERAAIDPKDLIVYHKMNLVALRHAVPENHAKALAACEDMIKIRPDFYLGYQMMGRVLQAAGRPEEAIPFFEKAQDLGPKNPG